MRKKRRYKHVARAALQLPDVLPALPAPAQGLHRLGHRQDGPRRRCLVAARAADGASADDHG
eukprot:5153412-Prymnesium_polylepis.1